MSKSVSAVIVDDEIYGRQNLSQMLQKHCPEVVVKGMAENIPNAEKLIEHVRPDIVFLDIQMPRASGFDLLDSPLRGPYAVIIVSAYADYGIQAVKADATDYLLKPIRASELRSAVEKVLLQRLAKKGNGNPGNTEKIALPHSQGVSLVSIREIEYLEADNMYTTVHPVSAKPIVVSRTIKEFEHTLPSWKFFRIHKSYIINLDCLDCFHRYGGAEVQLRSGVRLPVSRRRIVLFHDALNSYAAAL